MAQVIWMEPALADLKEIANYIALDDFDTARRLVQQVFSTVERLEQFPKSSRVPLELKRSRYREVIIGPCRVLYRADDDTVYILFVMRGERQLRQYLIEERSKKTE